MSCSNNHIKTVEEIQSEIDLSDKPILTAIISKFNNEIQSVQNDGEYDFDFANTIGNLDDITKERITNKFYLLLDNAGYHITQDQTNFQLFKITWEIKTNIDKLII